MLADAINDYAIEHDWVFFVRGDYFRKMYLKRQLGLYPYLLLDGTSLWVVDGRRQTGDHKAPYVQRHFDVADPTCFDQVEAFLSATGRI